MKRTCLLITLLAAIAAQAAKPTITTAAPGWQIIGQSAHSNQNETLAADLTPVEQNGKWGFAEMASHLCSWTASALMSIRPER